MKRAVVVSFVAFGVIVGCSRAHVDPPAPAASAPAAPSANFVATAASTSDCALEAPGGGVVIPESSKATRIALAAAGGKALVTFFEIYHRDDGPDRNTAVGHSFDPASSSLGDRMEIEKTDIGDEPISAAAPVAVGADVFAVSCAWAAPAGKYACTRSKNKSERAKLFAFSGIANGGPEKPDIAAVTKGEETLLVVPVGDALQLFSSRVSAKKTGSPFAARVDEVKGAVPDSVVASVSGDDEAIFVYRDGATVRARRAGFDEKWRGKAIDLSAKGTLVGAPAVARAADGSRVVAVFSERAKASDPWKVVFADIGTDVKRGEIPTGNEQAQGPGIAAANESGCFHVSWVEGSGKTTRTKLARWCNGAIVPSSVSTLSSSGVEGGRAYLASDASGSGAGSLFAVWQEIPTGKPAELRVAKLRCR